jgi:RNA exonuclease 1
MATGHKRTLVQYSEDEPEHRGVAGTLAQLKDNKSSEDWQVVDRSSKRRKKNKSHHHHHESKHERPEGKPRDNRPALTFAELHKLQSSVKVSDLQSLVLYCLADGTSPQWISVRHHNQIKKAVVLMVPGLERGMFSGQIRLDDGPGNGDTAPGSSDQVSYTGSRSPDDFLPIKLSGKPLAQPLAAFQDTFVHLWPVKSPGDDKYYKLHSPLHAMLSVPLTRTQEEKRAQKDVKGAKPVKQHSDWRDECTPITNFIATKEDLLDSDYTVHPAHFEEEEKSAEIERRKAANLTNKDGWLDTQVSTLADGIIPNEQIEHKSITQGRSIYAIDCEMCRASGNEFVLTRISVVGWNGEVVLDELVKPEKEIVDYLSQYSGITAEMLENVTTTLADIQARLKTLLTPTSIIIGHSLNSDLNALRLTHPFIIDTSILFPHPRGPPLKSSLKWLAQKYISREIQKGHGTQGHDSIEDARACLDLVKKKCEKGAAWGSAEAERETIFKRLARVKKNETLEKEGRTGAVVDHGTPERTFGGQAKVCIACKTDEEVVAGVKRAVAGDMDGALVPGGGVDFVWARLRELEALQGWSNDSRPTALEGQAPALPKGPTTAELSAAVAKTVSYIKDIRDALPPCTLFIVYSGNGDPRELRRLQEMQQRFKQEYKVKKWDQLSVKWTDIEEQALKRACLKARDGMGFVCVT